MYRGYELRWNGALRESTWIGLADRKHDWDFDEIDSEDTGSNEEVVDVDSAARADAPELTGQIGALAMTDEVEEVETPLVESPMRTYSVVNMTWDVRKCVSDEVEVAEPAATAEDD